MHGPNEPNGIHGPDGNKVLTTEGNCHLGKLFHIISLPVLLKFG